MTVAIAVMAKAPQAGRCKTRLTTMVSPAQAASLGAAFLRDVTDNLAAAARAGSIVPYLAFAPAGTEAAFDGLVPQGTRLLLADGSAPMPDGVEKFGRCLFHAIQAMLAEGHHAACVLNADSPNLPLEYLLAAEAALAAPGDRVVIGPAEDGGYYLLGVKQAHATLFSHIDWSTDRVAGQTRARAAAAGLEVVELRTWYDVDEPETLIRLMAALEAATGPKQTRPARHTAACLASLKLCAERAEPAVPRRKRAAASETHRAGEAA